jgi:hypothetical protein
MQFELTEENFIIYALKNYDNPGCKGMEEFLDDLKKFKYIKRLLKKPNTGNNLRERLILNHIITLSNLFGVEPTTKMLFFKMEKKYWQQLKTFLVFLNYMPLKVIISKTLEIADEDIEIDMIIMENLKKI